MTLELELAWESRHLHVIEPATLTHVLRMANTPLNTRCGERGLCHGCEVEMWEGSTWVAKRGCELTVDRDMRVRIHESNLLAYRPQVLSDYTVNVTAAHDPLFAAEGYGVAVDVGTTTIALALIDLATGDRASGAAGFNGQVRLGEDVVTRIVHCSSRSDGLSELQRAVVGTIHDLTNRALDSIGAGPERLRGYVITGNTTMLHLVAGVDPTPMGCAPFTAAFLDPRSMLTSDIGLEGSELPVVMPASAAPYIGADVVGDVLVTSMAYEPGPTLLVDVGTNGEIVLNTDGGLLACATAAGPAFEGCGLRFGMRAGDGAIDHLRAAPDGSGFRYDVIGPLGAKPEGLCGSAYIDFLAEGRRMGLLGATGRFTGDAGGRSGEGKAIQIATDRGRRLLEITEADVARLLQAKAAIASGIVVLLDKAGVRPEEVRALHLAGGFGMHLDLENAIGCGLLPGFRKEQIRLVGNTSLGAAALALIDRTAMVEWERISHLIRVVELNLEPTFEDMFIDHLALPEP